MHDDIIDEATVRRGRRSANSRWGNDITVLLGDFLYTKSMSMALSQDNLPILRLLSDVTLRMIEGQLLEIERNGDLDIGEEDHLDIIRRKTADLFSACLRIGAMLAGVGERKEEALARYGLNLGICFQMVDDLLDFTAEEKVLGKPVASDLREGKLTLPVIFLLRRGGRQGGRAGPAASWQTAGSRGCRARSCCGWPASSARSRKAARYAERYAELARQELAAFEPSPYREALESPARLHPRPRPLIPGGSSAMAETLSTTRLG